MWDGLDEYSIFEKNFSLIYLPVNGAAVIFLLNVILGLEGLIKVARYSFLQ